MSEAAPVTLAERARAYLRTRGLVDELVIGAARLSFDERAGRIVFPWLDANGDIVYRTGRSINGEPKYLHTRGERPPLYASPGAWQASRVGLVEGQVDALAAAQGGTSAFATSGSSMSDAAAEILATKDEVLLVFDADEAGRRLTQEATQKLAGRVTLTRVELPDGCKDLGDVAERAEDPGEAVAEILAGAVPVEQSAGFHLNPLDLESLLSAVPEPLEYVFEPYLPVRRRVWGFGAAESGKSIWAAWVACNATREGKAVWYVSEENPLDEDIRRLRRLRPDLRYLHFVSGSGLDLALDEHVAAAIEAVRGSQLLVIDTLTACWTGDENDNSAIAALDRDALLPIVNETGATVLVLDHIGHPQAFVRRSGVNAGRGASAKGQKADVVLNFVAKGDSEFSLAVGKGRGLRKPPEKILRVVDTDDDGLDLEVDTKVDVEVADVADAMAEVIANAEHGYLTTKQLREAMTGRAGKEIQTEAMRMLEEEDPPRVRAKRETIDTERGRQSARVWRVSEDQQGLL